MSIKKISNNSIEEVLEMVNRQYLVGDLKLPQKLDFIRDNNVEIGITAYDQYTIENPHRHTKTYEYQYMLEGYTEYMDIETYKTYSFEKGDFYFIPTHTSYAQKSAKGTKILFIKIPSINDKETLGIAEYVAEWYKKEI